MKQNSFSVIGGDERSLAAISQLCQQGQTVLTFGINAEHLPAAATAAATLREAVTQSRYILLPLPVTQNHTTVSRRCAITVFQFKICYN